MKPRSLQINRPDASTQVFTMEKPVVKIGRTDDNDLILADPDRSVSRRHASITNEPDSPAVLSDLSSANGTFVNGRPVTGPVRLRSDDSIAIGKFVLLFREEAADAPFTIETGAIELNELQRKPQLLAFPRAKEFASAAELRNLELLYEVGMTLAGTHSVDQVTAAAVKLLFKIEHVHRATVMLWNEEQRSFPNPELHFRGGQKATSETGAYDPRTVVMSRTILNKVRQDNRPLLIRDTKSEAALRSAASIVRAGIQAACCAPLSFQGRFLGILYADNLAEPDAFSETDFRTFSLIAAQTGLALANAIAAKELLRREIHREALKAYLPPQVADLILASDGSINLAGKLQNITVLFADIRGFTRMSEQMDAREVVQMLNELFTTMSQIIFQHSGTLDKFIGDCIMALFGAPLECENSVEQALGAAIAMQRESARLNASRAARNLPETRIGIGLHTGPAVVGNIGSSDRVQYTAIGDTVNVASRLVSRAAPDQIIVSEDVRRALPSPGNVEYLGEEELKGRQHKLNIYSARWADTSAAASAP